MAILGNTGSGDGYSTVYTKYMYLCNTGVIPFDGVVNKIWVRAYDNGTANPATYAWALFKDVTSTKPYYKKGDYVSNSYAIDPQYLTTTPTWYCHEYTGTLPVLQAGQTYYLGVNGHTRGHPYYTYAYFRYTTNANMGGIGSPASPISEYWLNGIWIPTSPSYHWEYINFQFCIYIEYTPQIESYGFDKVGPILLGNMDAIEDVDMPEHLDTLRGIPPAY